MKEIFVRMNNTNKYFLNDSQYECSINKISNYPYGIHRLEVNC